MRKVLLLAAVIWAGTSVLSGAEELAGPRELNRDPFDHPNLAASPSQPVMPVATNEEEGEEHFDDVGEILVLKGIMIGDGWAVANVNGSLVRKGEDVDGYRLIRIEERKAVFRKDGREFAIGLDREEKE